jgi:hypothetical protein
MSSLNLGDIDPRTLIGLSVRVSESDQNKAAPGGKL